MRLPICFALSLWPASAAAQAPDAASLWDLAITTVAAPPALEVASPAAPWNPAGVIAGAGLRAGFQSIQTPDILGVSGILVGIRQSVGGRGGLGLLYGRVQVGDLVRTTTSPASGQGTIPVYAQMVGVSLGARAGPVGLGASVRGHDARFDIFRESGLTADLGATFDPASSLRIAVSSQFLPVNLARRSTERLHGGVEFTPRLPPSLDGVRVTARYGTTLRRRREVDHFVGVGAGIRELLALSVGLAREEAAASAAWRVVVALQVRTGRYTVFAARGDGLADLGANYRVGLDVELAR